MNRLGLSWKKRWPHCCRFHRVLPGISWIIHHECYTTKRTMQRVRMKEIELDHHCLRLIWICLYVFRISKYSRWSNSREDKFRSSPVSFMSRPPNELNTELSSSSSTVRDGIIHRTHLARTYHLLSSATTLYTFPCIAYSYLSSRVGLSEGS